MLLCTNICLSIQERMVCHQPIISHLTINQLPNLDFKSGLALHFPHFPVNGPLSTVGHLEDLHGLSEKGHLLFG